MECIYAYVYLQHSKEITINLDFSREFFLRPRRGRLLKWANFAGLVALAISVWLNSFSFPCCMQGELFGGIVFLDLQKLHCIFTSFFRFWLQVRRRFVVASSIACMRRSSRTSSGRPWSISGLFWRPTKKGEEEERPINSIHALVRGPRTPRRPHAHVGIQVPRCCSEKKLLATQNSKTLCLGWLISYILVDSIY